MKLELFYSPGSCPRVSLIALEESGAPFPGIAAHYARTLQRPSVQRAIAREAEGVKELESRGLMPRPKS